MQNESFNYPQTFTTQRSRKPLVIGLLVLVALGFLLYSAISAYITRQNTGVLQITIADKNARITAQSNNSETRAISTKSRLAPGNYQIVATKEQARSTATVTIAKQETTTINLALQQPDTPAKIYGDTAQNILATPNQIYYLNTAGQYLSSYFLGTDSPRPYLPNITPVTKVYWLSPTRFFFLTTGDAWKYYDNGRTTTLGYNDEKPLPNTVSFNKDGAVSYVTAKNRIVFADTPTAKPRQIGSTESPEIQTSIAPDKSVITSLPDVNASTSGTQPTTLYKDGSSRQMPVNLAGAANITWAPDSSKFSFTTSSGMFVYSLSGVFKQVVAIQPTNPLSALWLSSTKLLYAQNSSAMEYNTTEPQSVKLAEILGILYTSQPFALTPDGQHMYMAVARDSEGHPDAIYRFLPNYGSLSNEQIRKLKNDDLQKSNAKLLENLPYKTLSYSLEPRSSAAGDLIIHAQIYIPPNLSESEAAKIASTKQSIADYIEALGLNIKNYTVQYEIVHQTLRGV